MSSTSPHSLVSAFIEFSFDGKPVDIVDAILSLTFKNGSGYEKYKINNENGYTLRRGIGVLQEGNIHVNVIKTPDGKRDDSLKQLDGNLKSIPTKSDPKDYNKTIAFLFHNPDNEKFLDVTFEGYLSGGTSIAPDETSFPEYVYSIVPYNSETITVK